LKQNGMSGVSATELETTIDSLAYNYAILRPSEAAKGYGRPLSSDDFLGNLWNNSKDYLSWQSSTYGGGSNYIYTPSLDIGRSSVSGAIADLAQHLQGQANPLQALRMVDRMLQAATQVSQLHQDGFVGTTPGWYTASRTYQAPSSIQDSQFLEDLAEFAFEISRVNPTVTAGANPDSEWIETLWENGNLNSAAGGLAAVFDGFASGAVTMRRGQMQQALDYMGRLVKAAEAVDDVNLDKEVLKASTLSHLVNLGGAYASLNPSQYVSTSLFLQDAWRTHDSSAAQNKNVGNQIGKFLADSVSKNAATLDYHTRVLRALNLVPDLEAPLRNSSRIARIIEAGEAFQDLRLTDNQLHGDIFSDVLTTNSTSGITAVAQNLGKQIALRASESSAANQNQTVFVNTLTPLGGIEITTSKPPLIPNNMESRLSMPIYVEAPKFNNNPPYPTSYFGNNVIDIPRFHKVMLIAELVDDLYDKFRGNTKDMITRFRKIYYGSSVWNLLIISGTYNLMIRPLTGSAVFVSDVNRKINIADMLKENQEIKVIDDTSKWSNIAADRQNLSGSFVDMGHVFVAMDAVNRPSPTALPGLPYVVDSNIDNATWVGDLGGILRSLIYLETSNGRASTVDEVQRIISDEAEPQDLLGNIDGLLIAQQYSMRMSSQENGLSVSSIMQEYYKTVSPSMGKQAKLHAYASIIGLGELDRQTNTFRGGEHFFNKGDWFKNKTNKFASEEAWINYYAPQVAASAAQFILGDAFKENLAGALFDRDKLNDASSNADRAANDIDSAKVILRRFLHSIKSGIRNGVQ
jgi:hypothetical protein